jgi:hypothetical protein
MTNNDTPNEEFTVVCRGRLKLKREESVPRHSGASVKSQVDTSLVVIALGFLCNISMTPILEFSGSQPMKEIGDDEPYYSTKISIFSFIWAGLAALHKASTL